MKAIASILLSACLLAGCSETARHDFVPASAYGPEAGCGREAGPFAAQCDRPRLGIADFIPPRPPRV